VEEIIMIEKCPYCHNKVDENTYFCKDCNKYFISEMIKKEKSSNEFDYKLWAIFGAMNYVSARQSLYNNESERLATYFMQQTIEIYLKSFILKYYIIYMKIKDKKYRYIGKYISESKVPIIKYNNKTLELKTHDIKKLLDCCREKDDIFRNDLFRELINAFQDFDTIRYPSRLYIDKQIIHPIDDFVKTVRNLIYPNIIDIISDLQSGGIADMEMRLENDLKRSFFHDNKQFAPRKH